MRNNLLLLFSIFQLSCASAQETIVSIDLKDIKSDKLSFFWLQLASDASSQAISIPVIIAKGKYPGPVLGLTAAIHGNELNGIKVIQELTENLDTNTLHGTILAIPGLNQPGMANHDRRFDDGEDLNRGFPGKENGNTSQQYIWQIHKKVLSKFDYLIDMHTASFGRTNSLYVRGDLSDDKIKAMALLLDADIVLDSKGPSAGNTSSSRTMRTQAMLNGIPTITVEYGNPQVYQKDMVARGVAGVKNVMTWLKMHDLELSEFQTAKRCKSSYWIYVDQGGLLEVPVALNQALEKGDVIGILRNPFGEVIKEYTAPESGIVIGKSTNPVNKSGGRIIHLGILDDSN